MCFYGYFLSKMWFCLLGLSVFLLGALLHKFPHHSSLNSRGTRLELVALLLVTFVFYGYFWAGNPYEILLLLLLCPQDTNQFFSLPWWLLMQGEAVKIPSLNSLKMRKPWSLGCSIWLERGVCLCFFSFFFFFTFPSLKLLNEAL